MRIFQIVLLPLSLLSTLGIWGQNTPIQSLFNEVIPKSPNVAAIEKFTDIPVGKYTGVPNIGIPIVRMGEGGLVTDIGLAYHSSGVKVQEVASWVGMGWALTGGGVVSRQVRGLPDEGNNGFINPLTDDIVVPLAGNNNTVVTAGGLTQLEVMSALSEGIIDGQPDMFNFNFPGGSGKFFFDKDGNVHCIPKQSLKISHTLNGYGFASFTIVNQAGTRFVFSAIEYTETMELISMSSTNYPTAWHLTEIIDVEGQRMVFNYADEHIELPYLSRREVKHRNIPGFVNTFFPNSNLNCELPDDQAMVQHIYSNSKRLLSIQIPHLGQELEFVGSSIDRLDLAGSKKLEAIRFKSNAEVVKVWALGQSYYSGRLFLTGLVETSGGEAKPPYQFTYQLDQALPPYNSNTMDHWGYYNGQVQNTTLIPAAFSCDVDWAGANREPDNTNDLRYATAGILTGIKYPAGGGEEFEYELNEVGYVPDNFSDPLPTSLAGAHGAAGLTVNRVLARSCTPVNSPNSLPLNLPNLVKHTERVSVNGTDCGSNCVREVLFTPNYTQCVKYSYTVTHTTGAVPTDEDVTNARLIPASEPIPMGTMYNDYGTNTSVVTLQAGVTYRLYVASGSPGVSVRAEITWEEQVAGTVKSKKIGGLRVKRIKTKESLSSTMEIKVRRFEYKKTDEPDRSSGHLMGHLKYWEYEVYGVNDNGTKVYNDPLYLWQGWTQYVSAPLGTSNHFRNCFFLRTHSNSLATLVTTQGSHVGYSEVREIVGDGSNGYQIDKFTTTPLDNVVYEQPYPYSTSYDHRRGLPISTEVYRVDGTKAQTSSNEYRPYTTGEATCVLGTSAIRTIKDPQPALSIYQAALYYTLSEPVQLSQTSSKVYGSNGIDFLSSTTQYTYDPVTYQVRDTRTTNSDGVAHIQRNFYPTDYDLAQAGQGHWLERMVSLNMVGVPIETYQLTHAPGATEKVVGSTAFKFSLHNNIPRLQKAFQGELPAPMTFSSSLLGQASSSGAFNLMGGFKEIKSIDGYTPNGMPTDAHTPYWNSEALLWDMSNSRPTARALNATSTEIAYTSFEEQDLSAAANGNWTLITISGNGWMAQDSKTGAGHYALTDTRATSWTAPHAGTYRISFWAKQGAVQIWHDGQLLQTGHNAGMGWKRFSYDVALQAGIAVILKGAPGQPDTQIDELRLQPADAVMATYCYHPVTRLPITISDENGNSASFEYDGFQRLKLARDMDGNILASYDYHYKGNGTLENHVRTTQILTEGITSLTQVPGLSLGQMLQSVGYVDGLGRPVQQIAIGAGGDGEDIITPVAYDAFGRSPKSYLPYALANNNGQFRSQAIAEQASFYDNFLSQSMTSTPYTETAFEPSPLNRPIAQWKPGREVLGSGNDATTLGYAFNQANEVPLLTPNATQLAYYSANSLIVEAATSETGNTTHIYKDKLGRTIMSRQNTGANGAGPYAHTYYVYDDFGRISHVLTPKAYQWLMDNQSGNLQSFDIAELVYRYTYDERGRVIVKKIPSKAEVHTVYDLLDRPILVQDGNRRAEGEWLSTKYDKLGRPVLNAIWHSPLTRVQLQAQANTASLLCETRTAGGHGYTLYQSFPAYTPQTEILSISYYDDYDYDRNGVKDADNEFLTSQDFPEPPVDFIYGKLTGTKVKVLDGGNTYLKTITFYDKRGRSIQIQGENHLCPTCRDVTYTKYDFAGKVTKSQREHINPLHPSSSVVIQERTDYDHAGRPTGHFHKVGSQEVMLTQQIYDILGRAVSKNLHSKNGGANFLQSIDYDYNARGWLMGINDPWSMCGEQLPYIETIEDFDLEVWYKEQEANGGVVEGLKLDDLKQYFVNSNYQATESDEAIVTFSQTQSLLQTLTDKADVDMEDWSISKDNIGSALEELKDRVKESLEDEGVTNEQSKELIAEQTRLHYRNEWLAKLRTLQGEEDNCDLFAQTLQYLPDGNITETDWRVYGRNYMGAYQFAYDGLGRMTQSNYFERPTVGFIHPNIRHSVDNYNEWVGYDLNGNITSMGRRGMTSATGATPAFGYTDALLYQYQGDQLMAVQDVADQLGVPNSDASKGFVDGNASGTDYAYDANGNLTRDNNKGISIEYNHQNKPKTITFDNGNRIEWLYDAAGIKLRKTAIGSTGSETTDYLGGIEYMNGQLSYIYTSEGRVTLNGTAAQYEYALKDHLGNSRVWFSDMNDDGVVDVDHATATADELIQEEHYYPFGLRMSGSWEVQTGGENAYQFNGIERVGDFGLGWEVAHFRTYDATLGRWGQVDPKAEEFYGMSTYTGFGNSPLRYKDPLGDTVDDDIIINEQGVVTEIIKNDNPHRLFVETGGKRKEIALNDPGLDRGQLANAAVGDKLVRFLSEENVHHIMYNAGVYTWSVYLLGSIPEVDGIVNGAMSSHAGAFDFGYSLLRPQVWNDMGGYDSGLTLDDNYSLWDSNGGFIFFQGTGMYKAYNVPDAGNLLWGFAMTASGASRNLLKIGSNANEFFSGGDASADQNAIFDGARYQEAISNPIENLVGYTREKPSWFSNAYDILLAWYRRR